MGHASSQAACGHDHLTYPSEYWFSTSTATFIDRCGDISLAINRTLDRELYKEELEEGVPHGCREGMRLVFLLVGI
jgi:hypothetical protein